MGDNVVTGLDQLSLWTGPQMMFRPGSVMGRPAGHGWVGVGEVLETYTVLRERVRAGRFWVLGSVGTQNRAGWNLSWEGTWERRAVARTAWQSIRWSTLCLVVFQ